MSNLFKSGSSTLASKVTGSQSIGINGSADYGPTSTTGFYNGVTIPTGGYLFTYVGTNGIPSYHVAADNASAIARLKNLGATGTTISDVLSWVGNQPGYSTLTADLTSADLVATPSIITSGLTVNLDAGNISSYPGTGTTWTDISGNGNNVTLQNSPTFNSGNSGYLIFNGSNQYGSGTNLGLDYITIEAWVMSTASGNNGYVVNKNYNGANVPYSLCLGNSQFGATNGIGFYGPGGSGQGWFVTNVGTNIMNTSAWYHVVGTFDGTTLKYYLNGTLNASYTPSVYILPKNNNVFDIGRYANDSSYFGGRIAVIRIYNRGLLSTEITQNYNAIKSRFGL